MSGRNDNSRSRKSLGGNSYVGHMQSPNYNNNNMNNMIEKNRVKPLQNDLTKIYMVNPNGGQQILPPGTDSPNIQY